VGGGREREFIRNTGVAIIRGVGNTSTGVRRWANHLVVEECFIYPNTHHLEGTPFCRHTSAPSLRHAVEGMEHTYFRLLI